MKVKTIACVSTDFDHQYKDWINQESERLLKSSTALDVKEIIHDGNNHYIHYFETLLD